MDFDTLFAIASFPIGTQHVEGDGHCAGLWRFHGVSGAVAARRLLSQLAQFIAARGYGQDGLEGLLLQELQDRDIAELAVQQ